MPPSQNISLDIFMLRLKAMVYKGNVLIHLFMASCSPKIVLTGKAMFDASQ